VVSDSAILICLIMKAETRYVAETHTPDGRYGIKRMGVRHRPFNPVDSILVNPKPGLGCV